MRDPLTVIPLRASLAWLAAALLALVTLAQIGYQALVTIPAEVWAGQSADARQILIQAVPPLRVAINQGDDARIEALLQADAGLEDLIGVALVDPTGRVTHASRLDWRGRPAQVVLEGLDALDPEVGDGGVRLGLDAATRTLVATLALPGLPSAADAASPRAGATPATWLLYAQFDHRRALGAAWSRHLTPSASLPWFGLSALVALIAVLLTDFWVGRPLRLLRTQVRNGIRGEPDLGAPLRGRGEFADLSAGVGLLTQDILDARDLQSACEGRLAHVLAAAGEGIWDWDLRSDQVHFSPRWKALLGYQPDEIEDRLEEWQGRIHADDLEIWRTALRRHRSGEDTGYRCEQRLRSKDGTWRWTLNRGQIVERDPLGVPLRMVGTHMDITDRKLVERTLAYLVTLETALVETSRSLLAAQPEAVDAVVERVLGAVARRMDVDRASVYLLDDEGEAFNLLHTWDLGGLEANGTQGRAIPDTSLAVDRLPRWIETLRHGEDIRIAEMTDLPDAWGDDRVALDDYGVRSVLAVPLRAGERLSGFVAMEMLSRARDWRDSDQRSLRLLGDLIGAAYERRKFELELSASRQRLEEVALYDGLTGLPNRRLLAERMGEAMTVALESGTQLAVCYLDLDGFKAINDRYGRPMGDRILTSAAARLREEVRESDTVARLGGDEFVLLMGGFESSLTCANSVERMVKLLALPYRVDDQDLRVTVSAGVTLYPRDSHDAETLLRHADHAMYEAKQRGRNRCRFFDTVRDRRAHARRSQVARVGEAIKRSELRLYYQPKVDMRGGRVIGAEGLVRWQHPRKGLLPPGAFIPLLDGTEMQQRLDWWVLEAGLDQLETWHAQGLRLDLSLNISARSIQHEGFVEELQARLGEHRGLAPDVLSLEILESEALGDLDAVARVMERCRDLGVNFALDDFGTGYSSLTYFRRLPARILKIDQTFVRDMLRSADDRNIVEGVVGLARTFQREVIAEGVESAAHGLMLLHMGCDQAQGYGVAEPMPASQFPAWVAHYAPPSLWGLTSEFDWSGHLLDLLTMEAIHRDWVGRLLRASGPGPAARSSELAEDQCGFGRWYYGDGRRHYGRMELFQTLEPLHAQVHAQAFALLNARESGQSLPQGVKALIEARDRLIQGLQQLQLQVLSDSL